MGDPEKTDMNWKARWQQGSVAGLAWAKAHPEFMKLLLVFVAGVIVGRFFL